MGRNFVFECVSVFFVTTIENGEEICIRVCISFFVFSAKLSTTIYYLTELSDISFKNSYSRDSNQNFPNVEQNRFEIFVFFCHISSK